MQSSVKYDEARPWMYLKTIAASLNCNRCRMGSQWRLRYVRPPLFVVHMYSIHSLALIHRKVWGIRAWALAGFFSRGEQMVTLRSEGPRRVGFLVRGADVWQFLTSRRPLAATIFPLISCVYYKIWGALASQSQIRGRVWRPLVLLQNTSTGTTTHCSFIAYRNEIV